MNEKQLNSYIGKNIKIVCVEGEIISGYVEIFTKALDNEPEIASITLATKNGLVEIYETEIKEIQIL